MRRGFWVRMKEARVTGSRDSGGSGDEDSDTAEPITASRDCARAAPTANKTPIILAIGDTYNGPFPLSIQRDHNKSSVIRNIPPSIAQIDI